MTDFKVPELGENITSGDVIRVLVQVGDTIEKEQPVVELETDKATVEVPSSVSGTVKEIKVKPGDKVDVGAVILTVKEAAGAAQEGGGDGAGRARRGAEKAEKAEKTEKAGKAGKAEKAEKAAAAESESETASAPQSDAGGGRRSAPAGKAASAQAEDEVDEEADDETDEETEEDAAPPRSDQKVVSMSRGRSEAASTRGAEPARPSPAPRPDRTPAVAAAPGVRRLAREIGVEIGEVAGSGPSGRISEDDVKAHAKRLLRGGAKPAGGGRPAGPAIPLPDFSRWGEIERQPMSNVRRTTSQRLSHAWTVVPHVTQFDKADITAMEELRRKYREQVREAGGDLTVTAMLVKVLAVAVRQFPQFNASIDLDADEIIYKKYVNVGVAVDTDRGLLVPVVRDAETKNLTEIAVEVQELARKARERKLTLEEMSGGGITISNLGGIGGTYFTPIVNWPEVAILGVSRGIIEPVWRNDAFEPRQLLPLSLSYDHRVIDGADAMRFLRWVVEAIEQPFLLSLLG